MKTSSLILIMKLFLAAFGLYLCSRHYENGDYESLAVTLGLILLMMLPYLVALFRDKRGRSES